MRETQKCEGAATLHDLAEFQDGLLCLTGGDEGPLAAALATGGESAGRQCVEQLTQIFGPHNVYVELQRHGDRAEEARNQAALRIAQSLHLPILATNGVRYATQYEREILDVFTSIRHHVSLDQAGRLLQCNSQRQVRSARAMRRLFHDLPEALDNTLLVSQRLGFELNDLGYEFPRYDTPNAEPMDVFLRKRVAEGIEHRYGPKRDPALLHKAKLQAEHELALIEKLGFPGYFLIVWDIVRFCKQTTSSSRAAAAPPTPSSATPSRSPPSTPSAWTCSSSASSTKTAASGPTSTSTFPPATSASRPSSTSTSATANSAPP